MRKSAWFTIYALALVGLLAVPQATRAAPQGQSAGSPTTAQAATSTDTDDLKLTDQQKSQIKGIRQQEQDQLKALRADTSLTPQQRQQKARAIRQNANSQVSSLLTPEQRQRWQQRRDIRADRRDLRSDRRDLRQDQRDLNRDRKDRREDVNELKRDEKEHASAEEIKKDQQDLREDRQDINKDKQDIREDKQDIRKDRKDLRKDRRRARKHP